MAGASATLFINIIANMKQWNSAMAMMKGQALQGADVLSTALGGAALAAAGGFVKSAQAAAQWEDQFASVKRTVDTTNMSVAQADKMFGSLEQDLRSIAKTIPITHGELAELATTAGALGVPPEAIGEFSRVAATVATLSDDLTGTAAAFHMGKIRTIFGIQPEDLDNFGSAIVKLGISGASTEGEILSMAEMAAGSMKAFGALPRDVLAYASAFSNVGVQAEAGGSAIQKMFMLAGEAVSAGGLKLQTFADVAKMTSEQFAAMFKENPAEAILKVTQGLAGMEDPIKGLKSLGLNQARWTRGWTAVISAERETEKTTGSLSDSLGLSAEAWADQGFMDRQAAERFDTFSKKMQVLVNRLFDLGITIGNALLPGLTMFVDVLAPIVDGINSLLQSVPGLNAVLTPLLATLSAIVALRFGHRLLGMVLPMGPLGTALGQSFSGVLDQGLLAPLTKKMGTLKTTLVQGIKGAFLSAIGQAQLGQLGGSMASQFVQGFKMNWKRLAVGGGLIAAGAILENFDMGGYQKAAGAVLEFAGAFALGGPFGLAIAAIYKMVEALFQFNEQVKIQTAAVDAATAELLTKSDEELNTALKNLQNTRAELDDTGKLIYDLSQASRGTIFSGLFGDVAATNERQIAAIQAELANRARGVGPAVGDGLAEGMEGANGPTAEMRKALHETRMAARSLISGLASDLQSGWSLVTDSFKPPKMMSFKKRLQAFDRELRQAWRGMRRSIQHDDPLATAVWAQRIQDLKLGRRQLVQGSKMDINDWKAAFKDGGFKIKGHLNGVSNKAGQTRDRINAAFDAVKTHLSSQVIPGITGTLAAVDLTTSGQHLVDTYVSGILSRQQAAANAAEAVAGSVRSRLAFSRPPQKGPLHDIRRWGPHMIVEWIKPIHRNMGKVDKTGRRMAEGMSGGRRGRPQWRWKYGPGHLLENAKIKGDVHFHIGTLIADDRGLDQLERRMGNRRRRKRRVHRDENVR